MSCCADRERGAEDIRTRALSKVIDPTVGRPTPAAHLDGRCVPGKSCAMGDTAGNCLGRAHLALASNLFSVRAWWIAADLRILAQLDSKQKGRQTKRSPIGGSVGRIGEDRHAVGEVDAVARRSGARRLSWRPHGRGRCRRGCCASASMPSIGGLGEQLVTGTRPAQKTEMRGGLQLGRARGAHPKIPCRNQRCEPVAASSPSPAR
jgi:hypothetical protein